jgi:hypothetical protein
LKSLIYPTTTRFKSSDPVFAHGFDHPAGRKSSDHSGTGIERESERVAVPPRNIPIRRRSKDLHSSRSVSSWRLGPIQTTLLATGPLAFLCVILVIQNIHPAPDKLTLQKDAAELASLETQSRKDDRQIKARTSPSVAVSNTETARIDARVEEHSQSQATKSGLIASHIISETRKTEAGSGEPKAQLRAFKRDLGGRPDYVRNSQRQRAAAPTRPYKKQGLSSFFAAIGRALGFSRN